MRGCSWKTRGREKVELVVMGSFIQTCNRNKIAPHAQVLMGTMGQTKGRAGLKRVGALHVSLATADRCAVVCL
jgi:hypothetical protein